MAGWVGKIFQNHQNPTMEFRLVHGLQVAELDAFLIQSLRAFRRAKTIEKSKKTRQIGFGAVLKIWIFLILAWIHLELGEIGWN